MSQDGYLTKLDHCPVSEHPNRTRFDITGVYGGHNTSNGVRLGIISSYNSKDYESVDWVFRLNVIVSSARLLAS